jgi:hypothetical protein
MFRFAWGIDWHSFAAQTELPGASHIFCRSTPGPSDQPGSTVAEVLSDLDRQFPEIRFRIVDEQGRIGPRQINGVRS